MVELQIISVSPDFNIPHLYLADRVTKSRNNEVGIDSILNNSIA